MSTQTQIPHVLWAQQRDSILLTIAVTDIEKVNVKFEENSVSFNGTGASAKDTNTYAVKIDLYEKIDTDHCKYQIVGQKFWRILLKKKDSSTAWPRLTKDKVRLHWLQTDFDHWKDEDESDDEKPAFNGNFQDMFGGGMGNFDDMPNVGDGSDDEDEEEGGADNQGDASKSTETATTSQESTASKAEENTAEKSGEETKTSVQESASSEQSA